MPKRYVIRLNKMTSIRLRNEQQKERRIGATALEIPPLVRARTTNHVIRSLAMCIDRHGLPYKSTKGGLVGSIEVVELNGCTCAVIDYPGHRAGKGMSFLIEPSGMVMIKADNGGMPAKLPLMCTPEVAFQEDQDEAFHELNNGQSPRDE
jgi:hypothetical protein